MARIDELGERQDRVRLLLGGFEVKIYGTYQVTSSVFQQPAAFTMQLGWGDTVKVLRAAYPPGTPFELRIGDVTVQTGELDAATARVGSGGTTLQLDGRDSVARLYDAFVASDRSFANKSYIELVEDVLMLIGLGDRTVIAGNEAHRKAITGSKIVETKPSALAALTAIPQDQLLEVMSAIVAEGAAAPKTIVQNTIKATLGTRWFDFINNELKKAGLFLWADIEGAFRLGRPTIDQSPLARIVHRRGSSRDVSNVIESNLRESIAQRYTRSVVYGRTGGQKFGRRKVRAEYVDDEMVAILGDPTCREVVFHEPDVDSVRAAEFMARRRIAEANRAGWSLEYTLSGHTTVGLHGEKRVVWAPDTMIEVDDGELGLTGTYYCHEVTFDRGPHTTTTLKLMRPEDVIFGEDVKKAV